jgi:hypothetical protein
VAGGGARNATLMRMLAERLKPASVETADAVGWSSQSFEAQAFEPLAKLLVRRIFHSEREQIVASALASRMVFPQRITSRTGARTCLYARRYQTPGITFKDSFSRCCGKR